MFLAPGVNVLCLLRPVSKTRHDWFFEVEIPAQAKDLRLPEIKKGMLFKVSCISGRGAVSVDFGGEKFSYERVRLSFLGIVLGLFLL